MDEAEATDMVVPVNDIELAAVIFPVTTALAAKSIIPKLFTFPLIVAGPEV